MNLINCTQDQADAALVELARHAPVGKTFGRPLLVSGEGGSEFSVLVDTDPPASWYVDGRAASRLVELSADRYELTEYQRGIEISRKVG